MLPHFTDCTKVRLMNSTLKVLDLRGTQITDGSGVMGYLEASTLLCKNSTELMAFFEERGCPDIRWCLLHEGVSGANISMLLPANSDAMPLSLGQQLALKSFVERMKLVSAGTRHWQEFGAERSSTRHLELWHEHSPAGCILASAFQRQQSWLV